LTHPLCIKVLIVEPLVLLRDALTCLLQSVDGMVVVGQADGASGLMPVVDATQPDVVLLAIDGTGDVGSALLEELPRLTERAPVVVLSADPDPGLHARAIELGAFGLVMKTQSAQVLVKAIQKVHAGELWLDRAHMARVVKCLTRRRPEPEPEASRIASLTTRERQIVELVAEGLRNKDIGERLFISESTARNHLTSILDKLDLADRFQLAVYAFRRGLVLCPPAAPLLAGPARLTSYSAAAPQNLLRSPTAAVVGGTRRRAFRGQ
jgi:two-component system nitrate/nitrite response regulator NarL